MIELKGYNLLRAAKRGWSAPCHTNRILSASGPSEVESNFAEVIFHDARMKKVLLYVPVVLSLVILGAHFMRYGHSTGVVGSMVLIALLFVRKAWAARLIQVVLILGALEWLRTIFELAQVRATLGQPFARMLVILGVVTALTVCAALLFQSPTLKRIYRLDRGN